jgi:3-hydroxyacyl-[acyl-carrier-protein] dehydratase
MYSFKEINEILPFRVPSILIDRVTELIPGEYAKGIKNYSLSEDYFEDHFRSDLQIVPIPILTESIGQLGIFTYLSLPENQKKSPLLLSIRSIEYYKDVYPSDQVVIEYHSKRSGSSRGYGIATGKVNGELVVKGEYVYTWE